MAFEFFHNEDYQTSSVGVWPRFSSSSKDKVVAFKFSQEQSVTFTKAETAEHILIFEIYLTKDNNPVTNVDIDTHKLTFIDVEKEVLLLPFFTY